MSKIAVFFDAENVPPKKIPQIISALNKKGDVLFQRAYADWSMENTKGWKDQLSKTPITAIQQFHEKTEKQNEKDSKESVDKAIMMDCIEMAIKHDEIDVFALITSDNGYYTLALRLRELGKRVIGMGEKEKCKTNLRWVNSCNEFSYFEDLEEVDNEILLDSINSQNQRDKENLEDTTDFQDFSMEKFLEKAFNSTPLYKDTNAVLVSRFWESVLRMKSDFNVNNYGKNTPLEFIKSYEDKFKIYDDGKSPRTYFIEKLETPILENSQRKIGKIKRIINHFCIITADDNSGDYFFYLGDVNPDSKNIKLRKDMEVDFAITKMPDLQATETKNRNGKAVDVKIVD